MSNLSIPKLLIASHIIPWSIDKRQRLNPRNGLCLSAIHDRAFDEGYLTVFPDMTIRVSEELKTRATDSPLTAMMVALEGEQISLPEKFRPSEHLLQWHNNNIFKR